MLRGRKKKKQKTKKTFCAPGPRERSSGLHRSWSQTCLWVFKCLLQRQGSAEACHGDRGSGCSRSGRHSVWHKSSGERSLLVPLQSHQTDTQIREQLHQRSSHTVAKVLGPTIDFPTWGFGKRTESSQENRFLKGTTKSCVHQDSGQRSSDPTVDWARLAVSVQESLAEVWVNSGLPEQAWEQQHAGISPFEGCRHYHHYPYHSLANYREGTQPHPSAENWIKDLLSMTLPTRVEQACFTHS